MAESASSRGMRMSQKTIDRNQVVLKILDYLNGRLTDPQLVAWAEDTMLVLNEQGEHQPDQHHRNDEQILPERKTVENHG